LEKKRKRTRREARKAKRFYKFGTVGVWAKGDWKREAEEREERGETIGKENDLLSREEGTRRRGIARRSKLRK